MDEESRTALLALVGDSGQDLIVRLRALEQLGATRDRTLIPELRGALARPSPEEDLWEDWDPLGAERVVDLHILRALHRLGDDSEIGRIAGLVREATDVLLGPYDELANAVETIRTLGRVEPVAGVAALLDDGDPRAVRNAVRVLDALELPAPPVGQNLQDVAAAHRSLTFTIDHLKEELETIEALSEGVVVLSAGTREFAGLYDYDRGTVVRQDRSLREILSTEVRLLGLDYYAEGEKVVICTYPEAAGRWRAWWQAHGRDLVFLRPGRAV